MSRPRGWWRWPLTAVGAAVCAGVLGVTGAASTEPSPAAGLLAFSTEHGMFTIGPQGGPIRRISGDWGAFQPRWSPDGRSLAWTANFATIWRYAADGSRPRRLTAQTYTDEGEPQDTEPAWSPDGRWILFTRITAKRPSGEEVQSLWRVPAAGGVARRVYAGPASVEHPAWSPDGRRLAFNDVDGRLWSTRPDGSDRRRLGPSRLRGKRPLWSPDGGRVAFVDVGDRRYRGRLSVLDTRTVTVRRLAPLNLAPVLTQHPSTSYSWSPDGKWIALMRLRATACPSAPDCGALEIVLVRVRDGRTRTIYSRETGGADSPYGLDWRGPLDR